MRRGRDRQAQEEDACNYDATATDAGTCDHPIDLYGKDYVDCDGNCLNDPTATSVCDEDEIAGCPGDDGGLQLQPRRHRRGRQPHLPGRVLPRL